MSAPLERMSSSSQKLGELILYVSRKCEGEEAFGATKLNKILFFAEFACYARFGHSITEQEYRKLNHGPAPRRLTQVRQLLESRGDCDIATRDYYGRTQKRIVALREPVLDCFSADDIAIVDRIIERLDGHNGSEVSDLSHTFPGWFLAEEGETIPYETVFLSDRPLSESEKAQAAELYASRA